MNQIKLHNLSTKGKNKRRRKARGISAGQGRTAGRGRDGQKSRAGYKRRMGFEGGQNPLYRRVAKKGFRNFNQVKYSVVNVDSLNIFNDNDVITKVEMMEKGVLPKKKRLIKVLGDGELSKKLVVHADRFTKEAVRKIEEAGGSAVMPEQIKNKD